MAFKNIELYIVPVFVDFGDAVFIIMHYENKDKHCYLVDGSAGKNVIREANYPEDLYGGHRGVTSGGGTKAALLSSENITIPQDSLQTAGINIDNPSGFLEDNEGHVVPSSNNLQELDASNNTQNIHSEEDTSSNSRTRKMKI